MRVLSLIVLSFLCSFSLTAQKKDSLLTVLKSAEGEMKVKTLNELFRATINSNPVEAIGYSREALDLAKEINDQRGMAASLNNIGVAYRNQGALDRSLSYYIQSMNIYDTLKNIEGIATTKNNISNIYAVKKDYGQAMKYLEESYNAFVLLGDQARLVGSNNNLGILYSDLHLTERATKYFTESYQLSEKLGSKFADPLTNIGNIYFESGNYQRAIEQYRGALAIEQENNNQLGVLNATTNIGIAYTKAGHPVEGEQYLLEAESMAMELNSLSSLPSILRYRADGFYQQGKLKDAYKTILSYDSIREQVFGEESSRNIAQLEMALSLQQKEKEFDDLQKSDVINTLHLRNSRLFVVLGILGLISLIAVGNIYYMRRKKSLVG